MKDGADGCPSGGKNTPVMDEAALEEVMTRGTAVSTSASPATLHKSLRCLTRMAAAQIVVAPARTQRRGSSLD